MECILSLPGLQLDRRWVVVTRDARHYQSVGFAPLEEPGTYLEMIKPTPQEVSASWHPMRRGNFEMFLALAPRQEG